MSGSHSNLLNVYYGMEKQNQQLHGISLTMESDIWEYETQTTFQNSNTKPLKQDESPLYRQGLVCLQTSALTEKQTNKTQTNYGCASRNCCMHREFWFGPRGHSEHNSYFLTFKSISLIGHLTDKSSHWF